MSIQIGVSSTSFAKSAVLRQKLQEGFGHKAQIHYVAPHQGELTGDHLVQFLSTIDYAIVGKEPLDPQTLSKLSKQKIRINFI